MRWRCDLDVCLEGANVYFSSLDYVALRELRISPEHSRQGCLLHQRSGVVQLEAPTGERSGNGSLLSLQLVCSGGLDKPVKHALTVI